MHNGGCNQNNTLEVVEVAGRVNDFPGNESQNLNYDLSSAKLSPRLCWSLDKPKFFGIPRVMQDFAAKTRRFILTLAYEEFKYLGRFILVDSGIVIIYLHLCICVIFIFLNIKQNLLSLSLLKN